MTVMSLKNLPPFSDYVTLQWKFHCESVSFTETVKQCVQNNYGGRLAPPWHRNLRFNTCVSYNLKGSWTLLPQLGEIRLRRKNNLHLSTVLHDLWFPSTSISFGYHQSWSVDRQCLNKSQQECRATELHRAFWWLITRLFTNIQRVPTISTTRLAYYLNTRRIAVIHNYQPPVQLL